MLFCLCFFGGWWSPNQPLTLLVESLKKRETAACETGVKFVKGCRSYDAESVKRR